MMLFSELINIAGIDSVKGNVRDFEVAGLCYDSRKAVKDCVFFAVKGLKDDGSRYASDAVNKGASAVICETATAENISETAGIQESNIIGVGNVRKTMSEMSIAYYDDPSSKLKLIGITGTNGKTSITFILKKIFEKAGCKCGVIGTVKYIIGDEIITSGLTTPDSVDLNRMMSEMVRLKTEFCLMEVSSIALENYRVYGLKFDTAVFTNLTSEHMDLHLNMENYFSAKKILFDTLGKASAAVSNSDDEYGAKILSSFNGKKIFYSVNTDSDYIADNISMSLSGLEFRLNNKYSFSAKVTGKFNVYNILASVAVARKYGIPFGVITEAVKEYEAVSGRFNKIDLPNSACAIIDYSHTSDSLRNAIEAAVEIRNREKIKGRVITVFGCGGNRDRTKRPVMGKIASDLSDIVILTSDNPRFEDPMDIIKEIEAGIDNGKEYLVDADRDSAIRKAVEMSMAGDIVLICGKGHEDYQEVRGVKSHFDDKEIVIKYSNLAK